MFQHYGIVLAFFVVAVLFVTLITTIPLFLAPRSKDKDKREVYECGERPIVDAWVQMPIRYYLVALIFLAFDVEVIFLAPWAAIYRETSGMCFWVEILVFFGILFLALLYAIREEAFKW